MLAICLGESIGEVIGNYSRSPAPRPSPPGEGVSFDGPMMIRKPTVGLCRGLAPGNPDLHGGSTCEGIEQRLLVSQRTITLAWGRGQGDGELPSIPFKHDLD